MEYLRIRVGPKADYTHRKVYTQRALQPFMYYRRASYCLAIPNSFRHYYAKQLPLCLNNANTLNGIKVK